MGRKPNPDRPRVAEMISQFAEQMYPRFISISETWAFLDSNDVSTSYSMVQTTLMLLWARNTLCKDGRRYSWNKIGEREVTHDHQEDPRKGLVSKQEVCGILREYPGSSKDWLRYKYGLTPVQIGPKVYYQKAEVDGVVNAFKEKE